MTKITMELKKVLGIASMVVGLNLGLTTTGEAQTVLLNEAFTGGTLPGGWTATDVSSSGTNWSFDNPGVRTLTGGSPGFDDDFAIFDSDNGCNSAEEGTLESPAFDASLPGTYRLEFDNSYRTYIGGGQEGHVEVWNGTAWVEVMAFLPGTDDGYPNPGSHKIINITAATGNANGAKVRFNSTNGECDWWWAVDNIKVTRLSCTAPSATFAIVPDCANNQFSVAVNVTGLGTATSVSVMEGVTAYGAPLTAPGTVTAGPFANASSHTFTLVHNIDALCNLDSDPQNYECPINCVTNISPVSGSTNLPLNPGTAFTWNTSPSATGYEFFIGTSPTNFASLGTAATNSFTVYGFDVNTTYYWYVVPQGVSAVGCQSNASSFTTAPTVGNDDCSGAIDISDQAVSLGANIGSTETLAPAGCNSSSATQSSDVWYAVTAAATGDIDIAIDQSDLDAVIESFSGDCTGLVSNNDCTDGSTLTIAATAGNTYYIRVDGWNNSKGAFAIQATGTPLPVTMDRLYGKLISGSMARLNWTTLSEQNNKGFDVQRSDDGRSFRSIGWVSTQTEGGNSREALQYQFTDKDAVREITYYRLQQVDRDGKATLSNIVRLGGKAESGFSINAAPNPVSGKLTIGIKGERGDNAIIYVTDISGKIVLQAPVTDAGTIVDMTAFAKGIYLLKYTDSKQSQTLKVTRQ